MQSCKGGYFGPFFPSIFCLIPNLPFLTFLDFLAFYLFKEFLAILSVLPFFPKDFRGSASQRNPCFFGGFPGCFPKKGKEKKIRDWLAAWLLRIALRCESALPASPDSMGNPPVTANQLAPQQCASCKGAFQRAGATICQKNSLGHGNHRSSKNAVRRFFLYYDQVKICLIKSSDSPITRRKKRLINWKIV